MDFSFKKLRFSVGKFFLGNSMPISAAWGWALPGGAWSRGDLLLQYQRYVYAVISSIAEEAAKVSFEIYKNEKPVVKHPFLDLMRMPNPDASQFQFLEMHFTYMKLCGESFWYLAKGERTLKPKQVFLLRPDLVEVVIDKEDPRGGVGGYTLLLPDGKKQPFERNEIIHFKMPNPHDPYRGLGTIQASKTYIETEEYAASWTKNSLYNSGRPSGVLNVKGTITAEEFQQVKKQFVESYTGTKNAGKTMLLKGADGLDYQKLGMELGEVALKDLKDMTRDDIMVMFRVSKTILGISDDVNRANALEARAVFTRNVIMPELDRMIDTLNAFLMPIWGEGFTLSYEDPTLQSDADRLEEWKQGFNKWLTINDIRAERNLDPIGPEGDVLYQPITNVPVSNEPPKAPAPSDNQNSLKRLGSKKKDLWSQRVEIYKQVLFNTQTAWEKKYKRLIQKEFDIQLKEILAKNSKKQSAFADWEFDVTASKSRLTGSLTPLSMELLKEAAAFALELADDNDTEVEIDQKVRDFIHDRISRLIVATNDQTIQDIEGTISEGVQNGESIDKLKNRIKQVYKYADSIRAERIARTETLAASNQGAQEAYRQSPLVTGKEWSAESDACEFCAALDGKIVGVEKNFLNLGQSLDGEDEGSYAIDYTDIETPPLHPNCRCAILPVALS